MKITPKQQQQFNHMLTILKKISKQYMNPQQMKRACSKGYGGVDYNECLEMSYENIQMEATNVVKGVRPLLNKDQKVQGSVAMDDESSNTDDPIKI